MRKILLSVLSIAVLISGVMTPVAAQQDITQPLFAVGNMPKGYSMHLHVNSAGDWTASYGDTTSRKIELTGTNFRQAAGTPTATPAQMAANAFNTQQKRQGPYAVIATYLATKGLGETYIGTANIENIAHTLRVFTARSGDKTRFAVTISNAAGVTKVVAEGYDFKRAVDA